MDLRGTPHRRWNALTREWVLVSPHRATRPWQGAREPAAPPHQPAYDPACYLCPGNVRAGGVRNPHYQSTFVFDNDFPALLAGAAAESMNDAGLLVAEAERGVCRVVCFSPDHSLTLARMPIAAIRCVVDTWAEQYQELNRLEFLRHVQIFENRGQMMGCSNPHPHGQIWATSWLPMEPAKEDAAQRDYRAAHGGCLLCDYLALEQRRAERVVCRNASFDVVVPFWAVWPFETLVAARRHVSALDELTDQERDDLAAILNAVTARYDALFATPFPYSMGFHQRPRDGTAEAWHLHAHFYPPLLRSATVRKFLVGFEMLACPQRDITPEAAAERLRVSGDTGAPDVNTR